MDFATESKIIKVLRSLKKGSVFHATINSVTSSYVVESRMSRRGCNGYIAIYVRYVGSSVGSGVRWSIAHGSLPAGITFARAIRKQRVATPRSSRGKTYVGNQPTYGKTSGSGPSAGEAETFRLNALISDLRERLGFAQTESVKWQNLYGQLLRNPPVHASVGSRTMAISADAMQFLRFSGIDSFPCSAEELKKGRAKMVGKLHPDTTQKNSNAQFCSAMRGFDELLKLTGGR